jgi:hypothetical protein
MIMWKSINGYEGYYEASDTGLIRSVSRLDCRGQNKPGKILTPGVQYGRNGLPSRLHVTLSKDRKVALVKVHHVIAETFIGPRLSGIIVCHRDGNPTNNSVSNLYYGTYVENMQDAIRHGTTARGDKNKKSKLDLASVEEIIKSTDTSRGSGVRLARKFNVSTATISSIRKGRNWGWLNGNVV